MEIKEILNCFLCPKEGLPKEAINAALNKQEEIIPHLLSILEHTLSNYESIDFLQQLDYLFALYILSKFREKKAYTLVLAISSLPGDWPEVLLGDAITESLPRFIVSTFDQNTSAIKAIIENTTFNVWSRTACLESLLGLVAMGELKREDLIEYLRSLFQAPTLTDNEIFMSKLVSVASDLYPEELMQEINDAFKADQVDTWFVDAEDIQTKLNMGKEKCLMEGVFNNAYCLPVDDVITEMHWINWDNDDSFENLDGTALDDTEMDFYTKPADNFTECHDAYCDHDHSFEISTPYVRPSSKVGRNDLCLCGSGKKYKKCCIKTLIS